MLKKLRAHDNFLGVYISACVCVCIYIIFIPLAKFFGFITKELYNKSISPKKGYNLL